MFQNSLFKNPLSLFIEATPLLYSINPNVLISFNLSRIHSKYLTILTLIILGRQKQDITDLITNNPKRSIHHVY